MKIQKYMFSSFLFNGKSVLSAMIFLALFVQGSAQTWSNAVEQFVPHLGMGVFKFEQYNDKLIVGGGFTESYEGELYSRIFSWDGQTIEHFGCGFTNVCDSLSDHTSVAKVRDIEIFQDTIYACGNFNYSGNTQLDGIAKWDGETWLPVDSGFNSQVTGLRVIGGKLHAVGWFTGSGATNLNGVAVLENGQWHDPYQTPVFSDLDNAINLVSTILDYEGKIYIGGNFGTTGSEVQDLGVYDPETGWGGVYGWEVGSISFVSCMGIYQNELVVGGNFSRPQNINSPGNYVCTFDGENWDDLNSGLFSDVWPSSLNIVYDLFVDGNDLYVSGLPLFAEGQSTSGVALWNGSNWCTFNPDFEVTSPLNSIQSICKFQDAIYIGGAGSILLGGEPEDPEILNSIVRIDPESAECTVSVGDPSSSKPELSVYPNPATTQLTIQSSVDFESLQIIDLSGRLIITAGSETFHTSKYCQIDVTALSQGVYVLNVFHSSGQRTARRFVLSP